jgi:hypothetical protein
LAGQLEKSTRENWSGKLVRKIGQENWAGKLSTKNRPAETGQQKQASRNRPAEIGRKKIDKAKLY